MRSCSTPKTWFNVVAVAFILLLAGPLMADRAGMKMKGTVTAVDPVASTVTVSPSYGSPATFNVTPSTQIKRNGVLATLADIVVGDKAEVKYDRATMNAIKIEAKSNPSTVGEVNGTVAEVDPVQSTLSVVPNSGGTTITVTVGPSTVLKCDDSTITLADIVPGDQVEVKYDLATLTAIKIEDKSCGGPVPPVLAEVKGTVAAVDLGAQTVSVTPKNGGAPVVLNVAPTTVITRNGLPATLADLQVGDSVEAKYDPSTSVAVKIEAKTYVPAPPPSVTGKVEGTVTAVDTVASTISIQDRRGSVVTLAVDANTVIKSGRQIITLADVVVGQRAEAKYDRNTLVAVKIEIKATWR